MAKYTPQQHLDEAQALLEHISTESRRASRPQGWADEDRGPLITKEDVQSLALTAIAHCLAGSLALAMPTKSEYC